MRVFGANEVPVVDRRAMGINLRSFKVDSDRKTNGSVPPPCMTEAPASAAPPPVCVRTGARMTVEDSWEDDTAGLLVQGCRVSEQTREFLIV